MKNKLIYRNAMRSVKDYFIYMMTMGFITAFMFAFDMMLFSESIRKITVDITIMAAMMGIATLLIVIIVA
ncbi:MAG: hypothetical protein PUC65_00455 [Clostridiales bacterium]|nr:hypothetical protein [Clostridiales bacterium]